MNRTKILIIIVSITIIFSTLFLTKNSFFNSNIANSNFKSKAEDTIIRITIVSVGDAMAHMPQVNSAQVGETDIFDFQSVFQFIKPFIQQGDISILNYETTAAGKPYSGYPMFSAPDTFAYALKSVGFNLFVQANNHAADKGVVGVKRTIDVLDKWKIEHTGVFKSKKDRDTLYPFIKNCRGIRVAFLNYTYSLNGNLMPKGTIINEIDTIQMALDIVKAKKRKSDIIVACMHWGAEYQRKPNEGQRNLADFLFNKGVDVIIGSHPHTIQTMEWKKDTIKNNNKLVFWSLGNFVSNQRKRYTDGGLIVLFDVVKNLKNNKTYVENARYIPFWVLKTNFPIKYYLLPINKNIDDTTYVRMDKELKDAFELFKNDTKQLLKLDTNEFKEI